VRGFVRRVNDLVGKNSSGLELGEDWRMRGMDVALSFVLSHESVDEGQLDKGMEAVGVTLNGDVDYGKRLKDEDGRFWCGGTGVSERDYVCRGHIALPRKLEVTGELPPFLCWIASFG
jgi:hypothetical protein